MRRLPLRLEPPNRTEHQPPLPPPSNRRRAVDTRVSKGRPKGGRLPLLRLSGPQPEADEDKSMMMFLSLTTERSRRSLSPLPHPPLVRVVMLRTEASRKSLSSPSQTPLVRVLTLVTGTSPRRSPFPRLMHRLTVPTESGGESHVQHRTPATTCSVHYCVHTVYSPKGWLIAPRRCLQPLFPPFFVLVFCA